jgi:GntR family transcriptional repressor for pyruvate dehydrogenase complex
MLEFRRMLEGQAAEWAAERATEADLQRLDQSFRGLQAAFESDNTDKRARRRHRLSPGRRRCLAQRAARPSVGRLAAPDARQYPPQPRRTEEVPAASRLLMSQHAAIHAAVRERKPQAARSAAETHIDFVRETLAQTLRSVARRETAERRLNTDFSTS